MEEGDWWFKDGINKTYPNQTDLFNRAVRQVTQLIGKVTIFKLVNNSFISSELPVNDTRLWTPVFRSLRFGLCYTLKLNFTERIKQLQVELTLPMYMVPHSPGMFRCNIYSKSGEWLLKDWYTISKGQQRYTAKYKIARISQSYGKCNDSETYSIDECNEKVAIQVIKHWLRFSVYETNKLCFHNYSHGV